MASILIPSDLYIINTHSIDGRSLKGGGAELIKFIINTISHSLGLSLSIGLSFIRYKNKTTLI